MVINSGVYPNAIFGATLSDSFEFPTKSSTWSKKTFSLARVVEAGVDAAEAISAEGVGLEAVTIEELPEGIAVEGCKYVD